MEKNATILCPTDFSECSLNAIEYASKIGEQYGAKLILIHVSNIEDFLKLNPGREENDYQRDFLKEKLNNLTKTVQAESIPLGLKSCEGMILEGDVIEVILNTIEETDCQLVVMGTEGMNDLRKYIIGSRTSQIVDKSPVDILVVPRKVFYKNPRKLSLVQTTEKKIK